ncbi:hypothetical protein ABZP36_031307 [Zizania latifolia]
MRKLIHLYLLGCDSLDRMPPNINLLNNLRTLTTFIVDTAAGRGIEELKDLNHLANRLELHNLGKIYSKENGKEANLHQKENLSELLLYWGRYKYYMPENIACNEEEVLESLTPHVLRSHLQFRKRAYSGSHDKDVNINLTESLYSVAAGLERVTGSKESTSNYSGLASQAIDEGCEKSTLEDELRPML